MPFTLSHPAIILPFSGVKRIPVSMSGLVIGSITPDFEYFIRMKLSGRYSHTIEGIFLLDLPLAFLIALTFHQVVKRPLIINMPNYFYKRFAKLHDFDFTRYLKRHYLIFTGCLLIGIASHIFWDSFTHANTYFVNTIKALSHPIRIDGFSTYPLFRYLQHISTLIGAIALVTFIHYQPVVKKTNKPSLLFWFIMFGIASVTFLIRALFGLDNTGDIVTSAISCTLVGLIGASVWFRQIRSARV